MADERDPKLSQHYRQLEGLEPPAELDRRILAAARERQGAHAPLVVPAGRHRWYYSLAAAAVLVLAVAVTLHVDRDRPDPEGTATAPAPQAQEKPRSENNAGGRIEYAPDPKPPAVAEEPPPAPAARAARKEEKQPEAAARPRSATPAGPSPQAQMKDEARPRLDAREAREAEAAVAQDRVGELSAMKRSAPAAASGAAPPPAPAAAPPERPERWLERIAEMRSRGRHAEADRELAEFRRVYPKFPISEVMRERVEGR